jgi:hypothetical protein
MIYASPHGVSKNRHGTYYAIKKVPDRLQEAVARVLNNDKPRQVWLKRTLGTKDGNEANMPGGLRYFRAELAHPARTIAQGEAHDE